MEYTIEVTQEDIAKGRPNTSSSCPIALAITRTTGHHVLVNWNEVVMDGEIAYMPKDATNFVVDFDCDQKCQPISFTLKFAPI